MANKTSKASKQNKVKTSIYCFNLSINESIQKGYQILLHTSDGLTLRHETIFSGEGAEERAGAFKKRVDAASGKIDLNHWSVAACVR